MPQPLHESVRSLAEATTNPSAESGLLEVEFITPGWGSSGYYSRAVVEAAAPLFAVGTHMYFDHPSAAENADRPERSVRDLAAVIEEAGTVNPATGGILGKVRPLQAYKELLTDEAFAKNVGLSIRGSATDITVGEAEGRKGPIIEGLADLSSVDFVTRAGRGGRVLSVLESAGVVEATHNDTREQLQNALGLTYGGEDRWTYVRDFDETTVWFQVSADGVERMYGQTYAAADGAVTLTGERTEVRTVTTYVPVARPGSTTTEESEEDTMPNIEESELTRLREDAGRVTALEERATTAEQRAITAERERDQLRARESAITHARSRVTTANAALPTSTVDRIVEAATRTVPLTEAGQLDTTALDTAVDAARTTEETYLAGLAEAAGAGRVSGFGGIATEPAAISESDIDSAVGSAFGRQVKEA
ncbi:hypothetical protein [Nocardioides lacusdianchii]|uniref:hypothetical protein n=1 Tax=Nocardioides lacusdianchii TaxID=2783664 RepID=UPI001CCFBD5B|nr:hypothetical protein [Nocardioides lacusdianchii]